MKINSIFLILIVVSISSFAQNIVEYDFETKNPPIVPVAKLGENSVFKIININKFLYEVNIETSQSEFNSEPPAIFSTIFQLEKKEESAIQEEAKQVIDKTDVETTEKESAFTLGLEKSSLAWNELLLASINEDLKEFRTLPDALQDTDKMNELNEKITTLKAEIETQKNRINELNDIIDNKFLKKTTELYTSAKTVNESFEKIEEAKTIKNKLVQLTLTYGLNWKEASIALSTLLKEYPFILKPEKLLASYQANHRNFKTNLQLYSINQIVLSHFDNDAEKVIENTKNLVNEIDNIKKKVDEYNYTELFQNIRKLYSELKNENNFFIASDPVQAKKDIINYTVSIKPRKRIGSLTMMESRKFSTEVPISGGVKIDFSTGLFVTCGLFDRSYSTLISSIDSTKSNIKKNSNKNFGKLSLGALMHISKRTTKNYKTGFTFGLGLNSTDLSNANVFVGLSGMFGTQDRFIVSLGASMANIDYLKPKFSTDEEILTSKLSDGLTEKTSRVGWFISFTYNLTNKKKE